MTRLLQGWTITNGLAVIWRTGGLDEVLLDEPDMGFADATDIAFTPDGRYALVTSSGTDRIAVVDVAKLLVHDPAATRIRTAAGAAEPPRISNRIRGQAHRNRQESSRAFW